MKESRVKRLIPKKLARQLQTCSASERAGLETLVEQEAAEPIARMRDRGYRLVTRLESGEGVFVRDSDVTALHVQIPTPLYEQLRREAERRGTSKKKLVVEALERSLAG